MRRVTSQRTFVVVVVGQKLRRADPLGLTRHGKNLRSDAEPHVSLVGAFNFQPASSSRATDNGALDQDAGDSRIAFQ